MNRAHGRAAITGRAGWLDHAQVQMIERERARRTDRYTSATGKAGRMIDDELL
jgi:hypothetical protein